MHPKIKAGSQAATVVGIVVALAAVFGLNITKNTQDTLITIGAAIIPVVAGYLKKAQ